MNTDERNRGEEGVMIEARPCIHGLNFCERCRWKGGYPIEVIEARWTSTPPAGREG